MLPAILNSFRSDFLNGKNEPSFELYYVHTTQAIITPTSNKNVNEEESGKLCSRN